jgi:hypothetical protein
MAALDISVPVLSIAAELEPGAEQLRIGIDECGAIAFEQFPPGQRSIVFGELRFVVEQLQMAGRARHEEENDVLRFGREVEPWGQRIVGGVARIPPSGGPARGSQPDAALFEEPAACDLPGVQITVEMVLAVHGYSLVIVSSRLRITRDTAVHAANCLGVAPAGSEVLTSPARPANPGRQSNRQRCAGPLRQQFHQNVVSSALGRRAVQRRKA